MGTHGPPDAQRRLHEVLGKPSIADRLAKDAVLSVLERDPTSSALAEARRREILQEAGMASGAAELVAFQRQIDRLRADGDECRQALERTGADLRAEKARRIEAEKLVEVLRKEVQERAQEITEAASGRMTAEKALAATQARCQALEGTVSNTERDFGSIKSQLERQLEHRTQELQEAQQALVHMQGVLDADRAKWQAAESDLRDRVRAAESDSSDARTAHQHASAQVEALQARVAKLERVNGELRRQRRALQEDLREVEELLAESERERHEVAQKYVSLGEKMEVLLAEEEQTRKQADQEVSLVDQVVAERQDMSRKAKEWRREAKRLERRVAELEGDLAKAQEEAQKRGDAMIAADKAIRGLQEQHASRTRALEGQVASLRHQVHELEAAVERSERRTEDIRRSVKADCESRHEMEMREQRLRYERRLGELEVEAKRLQAAQSDRSHEAFQRWLETRVSSEARGSGRGDSRHERGAEAAPPEGWVSQAVHLEAVRKAEADARAGEAAAWKRKVELARQEERSAGLAALESSHARIADAERRGEEAVREAKSQAEREMRAAVAKAGAEVAALQHKLDDAKDQLEEARQHVQEEKLATGKAVARYEVTKTRLTEVETALRGKERKAEDLKRDVGRLKSVVEEQQRKLEAALEELGDSKAAVAQLREEVESAEREARSLGEQLSAANTALEQEREAYAQLETQAASERAGMAADMGETLAILTDEVCAALDAALSEASHAGRDIQDSAQSAASAVAAFAAAVHRSAGADVAVSLDADRVAADRAIASVKRTSYDALASLDESLRALKAYVDASRAVAPPPAHYPPPPPPHRPVRSLLPAAPASPRRDPRGLSPARALSPPASPGRGDPSGLHRENRAMAESLRSLQRRLEEASRREAEAAAQSDAAARSIRGAAEELRKERDAEREGRRAAEGRAEALEKEVGELKGAVEAGVKERRLLVERLDEAERVGREERERYRETLGALKEQVSKVRQEAKETKADASAEVERVTAEWGRRMEDLRGRVREAAAASATEREVAVLKARREGEEATRAEWERRTDMQIQRMESEWRSQLADVQKEAEAAERRAHELQMEVDRLKPVVEAVQDGTEEGKVDALLNSSLKIKELKARIDQSNMQLRAAEQARDESVRAKDKLAGRLESLSEDMAIVLLTLRGEVPFDEEIAEGLLSNDKPTFSSALQDLKGSIQRHVARMEMKAAEEALDGKRQVASTAMMAFKKERHEKLTKDLAAANSRAESLAKEVESLREQLAQAESRAASALEDAKAAREQLAARADECGALKERLGEARKGGEELGRAVRELEERVAELQEAAAVRDAEMRAVQGRLAEAKAEVKERGEEIGALRHQLAETEAVMAKEKAAAEQALSAARAEVRAAEARGDAALAEERARGREALDAAAKEAAEAVGRAEREAREARGAAEREVGEMRGEMERELEELRERAEREVHETRAAAEREVREVEERARDDMDRARAEFAERAARLREEVAQEVDEARRESRAAAEEAQEAALEPMRAQVRSVQSQLENVRAQWERDVGAKEAECGELRRRVDEARREMEALQNRAERLQEELRQEVNAGDRLRGEKAGLLSTVEDLDGRVKYLEAKCSRLLRDSEAARAALRNDDGRGSYLATQARGVRRSMRAGNESSVLASTPSKLGVAGGA